VEQAQRRAEQTSVEVRLSSNEDQKLRYVIGGFYFGENQETLNFFRQGNISTTRFTPRLNTESVAAFGQLTFDLSDSLRLVAGGRFTREDKKQLTSTASGGLPGPAGIKTLMRYAALCGVGASTAVLRKYGLSLGNLIGSAGPDRFVAILDSALTPDHGPVRLHFYPFGGLARTLDWIDGYARARGLDPSA